MEILTMKKTTTNENKVITRNKLDLKKEVDLIQIKQSLSEETT